MHPLQKSSGHNKWYLDQTENSQRLQRVACCPRDPGTFRGSDNDHSQLEFQSSRQYVVRTIIPQNSDTIGAIAPSGPPNSPTARYSCSFDSRGGNNLCKPVANQQERCSKADDEHGYNWSADMSI